MSFGGLFSKRGEGASPAAASADGMVVAPVNRADAKHRLQLLDQFEEACLGWFWATNAEGRLIYISESAARKLGAEGGQLIGRALSSLFILDQDDSEEKAERPLAFLLSARNSIMDLPVRIAIDGSEVWWSISGKPQLDEDGNFQGYRGSAKDITAVRESQRDASRLAQYDSLTGLANRHRMTKRLTATLTAYKAAKRSCALMMLDLDRFKQVNDTLGHPAGDELLKQVAQRLQRIIGKTGEIGRLGGDEFQVILPDMDDRGDLGDLAERVIQMVSQPYSIDGSRAIIGTSVGIAIAPYDGLDTEELVGAADLALYAAKGGGRGQFRFYSGELKDGARLRRQIEEDLRDALEANQLQMHYQPVIKTGTNAVTALEALMRWEHPERGWISPADFIPVAEETNLITEIGQFALRQACMDAAQWPGDLRVAVNVSAVQFMSESLPHVVRQALADSGLDPRRLELEITESVFIGDEVSALDMFSQLKKLGVRLALDDFGTGYSSLGYLRNAPFDKIKIDQSFVRGLTEQDNNNSAIITAITSLAKALKMEVVAEGVEALDELEMLHELGVCHIQGFVFSKAVRQSELVERFAEQQFVWEPEGPAKHRAERKTVFRRIGVIHEDHRYDAVMRNLSRTGARIEGLLHVPLGTQLVLDMGEGQLVVATVRRSHEHAQGLEFETQLVSDGAGGLCTRHRISPYALAAAGMPLAALPVGDYPLVGGHVGAAPKTKPAFMQVDLSKMR
ncbi:MAG: EAL domain-containing protein [Sphingomonadaceae bacterium]|nr:EAL domain-containing protein [Sphingomonadaceae bacterium]